MPERFFKKKDRQEAGEVAFELGRQLAALSHGSRRRLDLGEELAEAAATLFDLGNDPSSARQLRYVARLVRERGVEHVTRALAALRAGDDERAQRRLAARDAIATQGDPAIEAWLASHPGGDRQRLRALARRVTAAAETARAAPLRALLDALAEMERVPAAAEPSSAAPDDSGDASSAAGEPGGPGTPDSEAPA